MGIRTHIVVGALLRRAQSAGAFATIVAKGDPDAGSMAIKINLLDGRARIMTPSLTIGGERQWLEPFGDGVAVPEAEADAYLVRRGERDPDVWLIEIEDRQGRSFLD